MRPWMMVLAVVVSACAGTTPAGPIGQPMELRLYLPDSLRVNTAAAADSTFHRQIRVGPDSALVELTWTAFQHGTGRYLGTIAGRLLASAPYDSLTLRDVTELKNSGSRWVPVESAKIRVAWFKKRLFGRKSGATTFWFTAAGMNVVGLPESR